MPPEKWMPVPGYEGLYEVSSRGEVRSLDCLCKGPGATTELHRGKVLTPWVQKRGKYLCVTLSGRKKRTVHSLVAEAFLGPHPKGYDVMHINGNRQDNRVENLHYGTRKENLNQTYEYGGRQAAGKLFKQDVLDIRKRIAKGDTDAKLAKEYGVHSAAINHIRNGTTFKWLREETT